MGQEMSTHSNLSLHGDDSLTHQEVTATTAVADGTTTSNNATSDASSPNDDAKKDQQVATMTSLKKKLDTLENSEKSSFALTKTIESDKSSRAGADTPENNDEIYNNVSFYLSKFLLNLEANDIEDEEQKERLMSWIDKYPKSLGAMRWNYIDGPDEDDEYDYLPEAEELRQKWRYKEKKHPFVLREIIFEKKFELIAFFVEAGQGWFSDYDKLDLRGGLLKELRKARWEGLSYDVLGFYSDKPGPTALDVLVCGSFTNGDESIPIQILTALRDKDLFRKSDIQNEKLLTKACLARNVGFQNCKIETKIARKRFEYLLRMNPQALLNDTTKGDYNIAAAEIECRHITFRDHDYDFQDEDYIANQHTNKYILNHHTEEYVANPNWCRPSKVWTPPLMIFLATRALVYFEFALTVALKVFGKELGLLLLQDNSRFPIVSNAVLLTHVKRRYGIDMVGSDEKSHF